MKLFIQNSSESADREFTWSVENLPGEKAYTLTITPEYGMTPSGITVIRTGTNNTITGIGLKARSMELNQGFYLTLDIAKPTISPIKLTINCK